MTPNLRDLGDLSTADGGVIASGKLLRSAVPRGTDVGLDGVEWPPSLVIDLRSAAELEPAHPLAARGSRVVHLPLLAALRPGAAVPATLPELYQLMLVEASASLVDLARHVGQAPGATLIHCAAGKDRTGVSVALLLRLVGVPRETVLEEYLLTNQALAAIDARLRPAAPQGSAYAYPSGYAHVSSEAIDGVLDVWDTHDGGVHGWFEAAGGHERDIEQLHRTLLV